MDALLHHCIHGGMYRAKKLRWAELMGKLLVHQCTPDSIYSAEKPRWAEVM